MNNQQAKVNGLIEAIIIGIRKHPNYFERVTRGLKAFREIHIDDNPTHERYYDLTVLEKIIERYCNKKGILVVPICLIMQIEKRMKIEGLQHLIA